MVFDRLTKVALILVLSAAGLFGANSPDKTRPVKWMRGIYIAESPVAQPMPEDLIWSIADARARKVKGTTLQGHGRSMMPFYQPGTVLVIAPVKFDDLRRGQTVVYYNEGSRPVAHVLVAKCKTAWRVAGLNNTSHDLEGVTAQNLFGVVVEAFHPVETSTQVASLR
ncbi:MAG: S24/S26 family peptidase [Candidatus Synoicihabitans palmerolidicus]|nr:S24/S26 family peptidase [Candidatus Synoicihabitans palmerolidicus]